MPTKFPDLFAALAAPFEKGQVKERPGDRGRTLSYITARTAANRLDEVLGPENWESEYFEVCECLACRITIRLPDGSKVSKSDGGGFKEMMTKLHGADVVDQENTDKTAFSDSFKRAAAQFLVGRYLYRDGVPAFAGHEGSASQPQQRSSSAPNGPPSTNNYGPPRSGKALYAWAKTTSQEQHIGLVPWLNNQITLHQLPRGPWGDWPKEVQDEWVPKFHAMALEQIAKGGQGEAAPSEGFTQEAPQDFALKNQRLELKRRICKIALGTTGKAAVKDLSEPECMAALALIDNDHFHSTGEVLKGDIAQCTDSALLSAYIELAGNILETQSVR